MRREKGTTFFLVLQSVVFCLFLSVNVCQRPVIAQSLPPAKYDGFAFTNHTVDSNTIVVEAFFDPVCPDSRASWPPLKQAIQHYGSRVSLTLHLLPLPYHDNAYATSRALHIVNMIDSSATFRLLESFFEHQENFSNSQTRKMSRVAVVDEIIKFTADSIGNSFRSAIESGFKDLRTDLITRVSFKYSASRGVFATPTFYVNGFSLPDAGSEIDFNGWKRIIDPLLKAQGGKNDDFLHFW